MKLIQSFTPIVFVLGTISAVPQTVSETAAQTGRETIEPAAVATVEHVSTAFREAARKVIPATLKVISHIRTEEEREALRVEPSLIPSSQDGRLPGDGVGTGFIVDARGIILTNRHVLGQGREIEVELADGRRFKVLRIRTDEETDLAALWIKPTERLPSVRFGDSDRLDIGDWVLAIGNPFDLDLTLSAGIISARGRAVRSVQRGDFLQTDASINPGNSGGPLVNIRGEVIGINTLIMSQSGVGQGIGFALPSNTIRWVLRQLVEKGRVDRAWFGVIVRPVSDATAKRLGATPREGVLVDYVMQGSPALEAGVRKDDILLAFDGRPLSAIVDFQRVEEQAELEKPHRISLMRGGKKTTLRCSLVPLPEALKKRRQGSPGVFGSGGGIARGYQDKAIGLLLLEMGAEISDRFGFGGTTGMTVVDVTPGGRAEKTGFKKGMCIVGVDGETTPNRAAFVAVRNKGSLSDGIRFDVLVPGGGKSTITVKTGE